MRDLDSDILHTSKYWLISRELRYKHTKQNDFMPGSINNWLDAHLVVVSISPQCYFIFIVNLSRFGIS